MRCVVSVWGAHDIQREDGNLREGVLTPVEDRPQLNTPEDMMLSNHSTREGGREGGRKGKKAYTSTHTQDIHTEGEREEGREGGRAYPCRGQAPVKYAIGHGVVEQFHGLVLHNGDVRGGVVDFYFAGLEEEGKGREE